MAHFCRECGKSAPCYSARCPACRAFGTVTEGSPKDGGWIPASGGAELIEDVEEPKIDRVSTGTREFDRVLGGGLVLGATYSFSGDPGVGKSTLMLQVLAELADAEIEAPTSEDETAEPWSVLIAAGEETKGQIAGRFRRLMEGVKLSRKLQLRVVNQNDVLEIEKAVAECDPDLLLVDSAQTLIMAGLDAPAGSATAVKACATYLCGLCKQRKVTLVMIAHVTKEGELAGPKTFEHLVDGVMHLSDEEPFRVLRMSKHRFASTNEVGIFTMTAKGLRSVENPSELLLEAHLEGVSGSVIGVVSEAKEGAARALLVEVQAIATRPPVAMEGATRGASWNVSGLEAARVRAIGAVLRQRLGFDLIGEAHLSIAGGLKPKDPGLDLPAALAVLSAALGRDLPEGFCCFGEIGLAGEIRAPKNVEGRIRSALAMKMNEIMGPPLDEDLEAVLKAAGEDAPQYTTVRSLEEACDALEWDLEPPKVKKTRRKTK